MEKFDLVFAVGAVAAALALGGVLYALYPSGFNIVRDTGVTSTASDAYDPYGGTPTQTNTAAENATASQNETNTAGNTSSPVETGNSGY